MTGGAPQNIERRVRRRRVIYIPGFDPVAPRKYRERYRREAARQADLSGYAVTLGKPQGSAAFGWHVSARIEGAEVETEIEVADWTEIVRQSMGRSIAQVYAHMARDLWTYLATGTLIRVMRLRKGPVIAALYPVALLLAELFLALLIGGLVAWVIVAGAGLVGGDPGSPVARGLLWGGALATGGAVAVLLLRRFRRRDAFFEWYLMHVFAFAAQHRGAYPVAQEARMAEIGHRIVAALDAPVDEVLVVGHSSGVYLAVSILADLIRAGQVSPGGPALSFLSLGHVVPMIAFLPEAHRLRADLAYLSARTELAWVDVTAPGDGGSFALCDPVSVCGVAPADKRWPLVLSAAFSKTLAPETWARLRWRFHALHFQYLDAFDNLPGRFDDYDYFRITAGPMTLFDRLGRRRPSASRIEQAVNGYPRTEARP